MIIIGVMIPTVLLLAFGMVCGAATWKLIHRKASFDTYTNADLKPEKGN